VSTTSIKGQKTSAVPISIWKRLLPLLVSVLLTGLVISGIVLGMRHSGRKPAGGKSVETNLSGPDSDDSAVFSSGKQVAAAAKPALSTLRERNAQATAAAAKEKELAAQQQAEETARATQEALLAAKQQELEQKAAEQAAKEKQLEQEKLRVEAEKQKAQEAKAEAEKAKHQAAEAQPRAAVYSGPTSGTIVWQGAVKGTTLVTINGKSSDIGEVVSGALPGVLVMIQPADTKHVGVASAPAPSNSYQRLTLRVQGNGVLQEMIRWSIP